jgi:tetratricopeptide (TPR) repeat protein
MNRKNNLQLLKILITLVCLFQLNQFAIAIEVDLSKAENLYNSGLTHYENKKYEEAIKQLESAVALDPEIAEYHHILAVSYGQEAKKATWFKAMDYAKRTLTHLEKSAELNQKNPIILNDLMVFYREAPKFLGGSKKKADEIEKLINKLSSESQ